ncbi:MAG: NAD(P)-binding protein [Rhizobiales bacterium]|nr:NAD(P)-binding protein [Hyphomicrobiales bacterium]
MESQERVFIAGGGPVGMVAAAQLVRAGVPVTVFEAGAALSEESRASTFHPSTLDMLDALGAAAPLIAQGLKAPQFQYRTKPDGLLAQFDFGEIADATKHPFRVQSEQFKLTRILYDRLHGEPDFEIVFDAKVMAVEQDTSGVTIGLERKGGKTESRRGRWLIGADGARSEVRRALRVEFEGFTWPERFLVVSTPYDFHAAIPDLVHVNYVADPERWHFLLEIPGMWRIMFPIPAEVSDETARSEDYAQAMMAGVLAGVTGYEIVHTTLYHVHQRVAGTYRKGRAFLTGDAAHVNNPLGGMGMNGGIHDAVNLTGRLAGVWRGEMPEGELDRYDSQRRLVTLEYVQTQSIQNKRNIENPDGGFKDLIRAIAADPQRRRDYLMRTSMIASLRRAAELG